MESTGFYGFGCLCDRRGTVRPQCRGSNAGQRPGLCQGSPVPAEYAGWGRHLAREDALHLDTTLFRERVPLWHGPMDLRCWNQLGHHRAVAHRGSEAEHHVDRTRVEPAPGVRKSQGRGNKRMAALGPQFRMREVTRSQSEKDKLGDEPHGAM